MAAANEWNEAFIEYREAFAAYTEATRVVIAHLGDGTGPTAAELHAEDAAQSRLIWARRRLWNVHHGT
jgi:hypothetical protein